MEKKTEVVIVNYIEKMLGERREKIIESDEYIRQDIEDLKELEERYASMKIPYMFRRVIDDYIACMESKSERYADLSYIKGMGDAISLLKNIGALNSQETLSMNVELLIKQYPLCNKRVYLFYISKGIAGEIR